MTFGFSEERVPRGIREEAPVGITLLLFGRHGTRTVRGNRPSSGS